MLYLTNQVSGLKNWRTSGGRYCVPTRKPWATSGRTLGTHHRQPVGLLLCTIIRVVPPATATKWNLLLMTQSYKVDSGMSKVSSSAATPLLPVPWIQNHPMDQAIVIALGCEVIRTDSIRRIGNGRAPFVWLNSPVSSPTCVKLFWLLAQQKLSTETITILLIDLGCWEKLLGGIVQPFPSCCSMSKHEWRTAGGSPCWTSEAWNWGSRRSRAGESLHTYFFNKVGDKSVGNDGVMQYYASLPDR